MAQKGAFEMNFGKIEDPFEAPTLDLDSKRKGTWLLIGAGLFYWGSLLDGVICYESETEPNPGHLFTPASRTRTDLQRRVLQGSDLLGLSPRIHPLPHEQQHELQAIQEDIQRGINGE